MSRRSAREYALQVLYSRELNPDIPEALELICMKAMCPDISKRYQTADAMLDDLEKFRKDPAVDMDYIREDLKAVRGEIAALRSSNDQARQARLAGLGGCAGRVLRSFESILLHSHCLGRAWKAGWLQYARRGNPDGTGAAARR